MEDIFPLVRRRRNQHCSASRVTTEYALAHESGGADTDAVPGIKWLVIGGCGQRIQGFIRKVAQNILKFALELRPSRGVAKLVKAPDFDSGMRRFESFFPCQKIKASIAKAVEAFVFLQNFGGEEKYPRLTSRNKKSAVPLSITCRPNNA